MKPIFTLPVLFFVFSCETVRHTASAEEQIFSTDTLITQSLFNDKSASISEENIQRLLDGNYKLPQQLRVAIVRLDNGNNQSRRYFWNDEDFLKTQQSYLDTFTAKLRLEPARAKSIGDTGDSGLQIAFLHPAPRSRRAPAIRPGSGVQYFQ